MMYICPLKFSQKNIARIIHFDCEIYEKDINKEDYFIKRLIELEINDENIPAEVRQVGTSAGLIPTGHRRGGAVLDMNSFNSSELNRPKLQLKENNIGDNQLNNQDESNQIPEYVESNSSNKDMDHRETTMYNNFIANPDKDNLKIDNGVGDNHRLHRTIIEKKVTITMHDYECLTIRESILYDKRSFRNYLWDNIKENHRIMSLIFKTSLFEPAFIRITELIFEMSFTFAISALLFTDSYIDGRAESPNNVRFILTL
jgi:hypothetical protein